MRVINKLLMLGCCALFAACSSSVVSSLPSGSSLVSAVAVAAGVHLIYDPMAPNWEMKETRLSEDTYDFSLKMKRYHTGGAGESIQMLKRRAVQLQSELGYQNYAILEFSEGIESETVGARRVAHGVVKLVQMKQADSFLQNR